MAVSPPDFVPVLIVGAGPTGLTLAAALQRHGVPVRLLEKKPALSRHTKATNLMQRSQEVLSALGLLQPMADRGGQMRRLIVHAYGRCVGASTMHLHESPFHDVLLCGQHNFEAGMAEALATRGVNVEFGLEVTSLSQNKDGVLARVLGPAGDEAIRANFVVGCDGAAGVTRTFTRHNFTPKKTGVGLRQVDARLVWNRLPTMDQMWLFYFDHGFGAVVPLPGGIHRVIAVEPKDRMPERQPTLQEMETKLREMTADPTLTLRDPKWFSYSDLSMGIAPGLRDGRILLAGDVGNPILPNGGQGMNTGIGDAFNLAWKLAAVWRGAAPDALLDTYEEERLSLRRTLESAQFSSLKYTTLVTPRAVQALFRLLAEPLLRLGAEYKMAQAFSQLKIHTRRSRLTLEGMGRRGLRAGDRALDAEVVSDGRILQLYELIYRGDWTLLGFTGRDGREGGDWSRVADAVEGFHLPLHLVSTRAQETAPGRILFDLDGLAHRIYEVKKPTLYLIRPDGHVAARVTPGAAETLPVYLQKWRPTGPHDALP